MSHSASITKSSKSQEHKTPTAPAAGPRGIARMPLHYGIEFVDGAAGGESPLQLMPQPARQPGGEEMTPVISRDRSPSAPNRTGLPDHLKAGIENHSGFDMSDVRVHYNSSQPAQLNALAYTQGTDIHVAAGEERHLPHEAWHVVQQKQGRVQPRFQLKGKQVNDDPELEREADGMGKKTLWNQDAAVDCLPVVQRVIEPYRAEKGTEDMKTLAGLLDTCVTTAKSVVDRNPLLTSVPGRERGYLNAWVNIFDEFTTKGKIPPFFYARYGYAIETIATSQFKTQDTGCYEIHTQATYGGTRPDFVIKKKGIDMAWIDITSADSKGHIFLKQGGGWKTRPYVAEVLYEMPDAKDFASTAQGNLSLEQIAALNAADAERVRLEYAFDKGMQAMGKYLGEAFADAYKEKGEGLSRAEALKITVTTCRTYLKQYHEKGDIKPQLAAGVLTQIDSLEIADQTSDGLDWANWIHGKGADRKGGRLLLTKFGQDLGSKK